MIIDFHCHILPPDFPARHAELSRADSTFATLFPQPGARMATTEGLLRAMDLAGVDHSVALGFGWTDPRVASEVNDYIIAAVRQSGERLSGFCSVNPAWGETALEEIERCAASGLKGVGELHPDTQGYDISDYRTLAPFMDLARSLALPVLIHASEPVGHCYPGKGSTTPDLVYRFIRNFPENTIICAHWGGGLAFYGLMPEIPGELKNVYFDCAASPFLYREEVFPVATRTIGADRILLGTDFPLLRHRRVLEQIERADLAHSDRAAILGGNAAAILGLDASRPAYAASGGEGRNADD